MRIKALKYADDPVWSDVSPISARDGLDSLAQISYTAEYSEAMSYLRAVMLANEMSDRVLALTDHIIRMNPAHYTVWIYRCKVLLDKSANFRQEIEWLNELALKHLKNYQIWGHRQMLIDRMNNFAGEREFLEQMLKNDAKNYHVWSYRQWLVQRFNLWESEEEISFIERVLQEDVRNNSAWNHRWYCLFGKFAKLSPSHVHRDTLDALSQTLIDRELDFVTQKIRLAPQNLSAWHYLQGIRKKGCIDKAKMFEILHEYVCEPYLQTLLCEFQVEDTSYLKCARFDSIVKGKPVSPHHDTNPDMRNGLTTSPVNSVNLTKQGEPNLVGLTRKILRPSTRIFRRAKLHLKPIKHTSESEPCVKSPDLKHDSKGESATSSCDSTSNHPALPSTVISNLASPSESGSDTTSPSPKRKSDDCSRDNDHEDDETFATNKVPRKSNDSARSRISPSPSFIDRKIREFPRKFASIPALEFYAEMLTCEPCDNRRMIRLIYEILAHLDPIRHDYWAYRLKRDASTQSIKL